MHPDIQRAVSKIMQAYADAASDPSSFVARSVRVMHAGRRAMDSAKGRLAFRLAENTFEQGFHLLMHTGYGIPFNKEEIK